MKTLKIILAFMCLASTTYAQTNETIKKKKYKISNAYILPMGSLQKDPSISDANFKKLTENSMLLKNQSLDDYKKHSNSRSFNSSIAFNIGISKYNEQENNYNSSPEFRIGFTYSSNTIFTANYQKEESKRIDTLTSNQTGNTIYYDSITRKNYSMYASSDQLMLDVSVLFRTNPKARWSLYGGIGVNAGSSINAFSHINYFEYSSNQFSSSYTNISGNNVSGQNSLGDKQKNESIKMENQIATGIYLPFGIDFRLGDKREFFKRIHGFIELRPYLNSTSVPELKTNFLTAGIKGGLGLRINF